MASIKVASWNLKDRLSDPTVQRMVAQLEADLVVLPQAMSQTQFATFRLGRRSPLSGYEFHAVPYDDVDNRHDSHALVVLTKKWLHAQVRPVNFGRTALIIETFDMQIACVHLDDRSPKTQLVQAQRLLEVLGRGRAAVIGNLNSAQSPVLHAVLRPIAYEWRLFGMPIGTPGEKQSKLARAGSLLTRFSDMTSGRTVYYLYANGFMDADSRRLRTLFAGKIPVAQVDHVLVRGIEAKNFDRPRMFVGEHAPIVAELSI